MTTGTISPKLLDLAWPLVLGNLLQTLYNLADMFWVGRVSTEAVAAVSLMFPLSWMFVSTALGLTAATIALVSQHVGAGNDRRADEVVGQTVLLATAVSVALAVLGFAARHRLLYWIGARDAVFVEALAYIEVILLTLPLTFLFFAFRASLQGAGDTTTAIWLVGVSAGINIVIDPVFILGWGPVPALGTRGAAIATLIARLFATAVGVGILLRGGWGVKLYVRDLAPNPEILRKLIDVGYPATLDGWARSFAAVFMAALVARFGPAATAAYGIGVRLMSVSWSVASAVGRRPRPESARTSAPTRPTAPSPSPASPPSGQWRFSVSPAARSGCSRRSRSASSSTIRRRSPRASSSFASSRCRGPSSAGSW